MFPQLQANKLYLSAKLPVRYAAFVRSLSQQLTKLGIPVDYLPHTKDIWARDYMPVQVQPDTFVQFVYNPDYLREEKRYRDTITKAALVCEHLNITPQLSPLLVDGGNVVCSSGMALMCDKVLWENQSLSKETIRKELEELLQVDKVLFLPTDPNDPVGHADGMVRFIGEDTVLVNDYNESDAELKDQLLRTLHETGLHTIALPYAPYTNNSYWDASGIYINYLHMQQGLVVPVYNRKEDETAVHLLEQVFPGLPIVTVYSGAVARQGGVLNCISWTVYQP